MIIKKLSKEKSKPITLYSSEIPEITYNYSEYQEPLVVGDYDL